MPLESTESLVQSLRASGLFSPAEWETVSLEIKNQRDEPATVARHLVALGLLTNYQLRKILSGRASELTLGPYRILDKLGEGGMGKVYRALHVRRDHIVALKVVREHLLSRPTVRGRYEREVQAALALSHPNIVSVTHAGSTDGRYFLEMEFVDGLDLSRIVIKHGLFSVPEACEYARQAALGLHHAHELGFVHRDIKPSNIMVGGLRHVPGNEGLTVVKILDMGLVRQIDDDESGLTRDGTVVGTPDYMAPEQAKNSRLVDRRADLYSLGATFYYMLTGEPPFPKGTALDKVICHSDHAPPLLSASRPDVPEILARIVDRLMAKKPQQRFATALELAEALRPLAVHPGVGEVNSPSAAETRISVPESEEDRAKVGEPPVEEKTPIWSLLVVVLVGAVSMAIVAMALRVAWSG